MNYESALENMMESSFGRIVDGAAEGNKRDNPRRAANDTDHECESDKRDQLRVANFISNANSISNRCTIFPASSPIAAAGASVSPNGSATSSRGDRMTGCENAVSVGESRLAPGPRESNFESGLCGFNELGRTSSPKPDNSAGLFPSKYIPPFFFSLMAKIPTVLIADLDNQQSTEGKRYEHPRSMDTWSEHERVH